MVEEFEIAVTSAAAEPRTVVVLERMARGDTWRVPWASRPAEKEDARTIRFVVTVAPGATEKVRYRVIYEL